MTEFAAYAGGSENAYTRRDTVSPPPRVAFHPIIDLDTGTVVAVSAPTGRDIGLESDVDRAILAAQATTQHETPLPLHLFLHARTLADDRSTDRLHQTLASLRRRPGGVIMSVSGLFAGMTPAEAGARLSRLRAAGYLIGIEHVADLPSRFVAEVAPSVLTLDPELARRAAADPRRAALVESLVALGRRTGGHVLAPGVLDDDQLHKLRGLGVRLAQGPLLTPSGWRPGMPVTVRLGARETDRLGPRVTEFMLPATVMPDGATADEVFSAFNAEPNTTSVVLVDTAQRPKYTVDRTRFLLKLAGAYGHALHAHKPARRLADPPRLVPRTVPAIAALRAAGEDAVRVYDDLVVIDEVGRCMGIARVGDLIRSLSELERRTAS
ncbi:EAL domain-containing protein [Actinomadura sp. DC4]|uniref:EAL domain-containing protein n=1 Tax=Actinomadura sp. DC4 TaxID=3055069 RepID=UPI0025B0E62C|nr:EAL domain-containing protein [Actinomadura sp. DC4]MDN3355361.1 EAL domain-containing protein [Actinomadura sp. DC4]